MNWESKHPALNIQRSTFTERSELNVECSMFAVPEGRRPIATGEAQRNPWDSDKLFFAPEWATESAARIGAGIIYFDATTGCAALHPWLPAGHSFGVFRTHQRRNADWQLQVHQWADGCSELQGE